MIMKKNYKEILTYVLIPLLLGSIVSLLTSNSTSNYNGIVPGFVFPIVWSVLYILMGLSSYLVRKNKRLINIYKLNLIVNLLWSFIFFTFDLKVLAFFWILFLILIVGYMVYEFYKENKLAFYLLIPYFLWLIFAAILNLLQIM
jgi:tryptophan-rich sensory protein